MFGFPVLGLKAPARRPRYMIPCGSAASLREENDVEGARRRFQSLVDVLDHK